MTHAPRKTAVLLLQQGTQPWLTADEFPVLVDGFEPEWAFAPEDDHDHCVVCDGITNHEQGVVDFYARSAEQMSIPFGYYHYSCAVQLQKGS
jgi:hypothetical protein